MEVVEEDGSSLKAKTSYLCPDAAGTPYHRSLIVTLELSIIATQTARSEASSIELEGLYNQEFV